MKTRMGIPAWAPVAALGVAASLVLTLQWGWNRTVSASADMTYHLQVLDAVRHGGPIPATARAYMDIMYTYANFGHRLAAGLTWLGVGDLNALTTLAVFSAALIWFCLFDQARRAGLAVLAGGAVLAALNVLVTRASFGAEVVYQFFYSQMAGEGFAVAALAVGQPILARSRRAYGAYAVLCTVLAGCIHLIPALHVAGAAMALLGIEVARDFLRERKIDWAAVAAILVMPAALVANPFFWGMRLVSSNDGAVDYALAFSFTQLAVVEGLLLTLSAWVLFECILTKRPIEPADRAAAFLAALGAAVAVAALAQMVAFLAFGESSPYAVRKEAFGVFSLLCLVLPLWVARVMRLPAASPKAALVGVVVAQAVVSTLLFNRPEALDVPRVDRLLADARALREARGEMMTDILFTSTSEHPIVNYIVSSAAFRRPRDVAAIEAMTTSHPLEPGSQAVRIAARVGDFYDRPACRQGPPFRGLVVVDAGCAAPPEISFTAGGNGVAGLGEGWAPPEKGGTWSIGPRAVVSFDLPPESRSWRAAYIEFSLLPFVTDQSPTRAVVISAAGAGPGRFVFHKDAPDRLAPTLPLTPEARAAGRVTAVIQIEDPVSPEHAGAPGSGDFRPLGVALDHIRILPQPQWQGEGWRRREEP